MASFSGVTFVLFCFALLCFVFLLYAFVEAAALRSIVLRYAGAPIATSFCFFEMSLFPSIFCTISVFSLYGEYVVRSLLPNGVFLPCDHGLDFLHDELIYVKIRSKSINYQLEESEFAYFAHTAFTTASTRRK